MKKTEAGNIRARHIWTAIMLSAVLIAATSCETPQKMPLSSVFTPISEGPDGYTLVAGAGVYDSATMKISARQMRPGELDGSKSGMAFLDYLVKNDFVLLLVTIENKTKSDKLIFNPAFVSLMDNSLGYKKPMDYTDLYDIIKNEDASGNALAGVHGKLYDRGMTLSPGATSSKFLLFPPLIDDISKADLVIKEIYIGKHVANVLFPFEVTTAERPVQK